MSLPSPGTSISLSTIQGAFNPGGAATPVSMGTYFKGGSFTGINDTRAWNVPASGPLAMSRFYSKRDPSWASVAFLADFESSYGNATRSATTFAVTLYSGTIAISTAGGKFGNSATFATVPTFSPVIKYTLPSLPALPVADGAQHLGNTFTVEFWGALNTSVGPVQQRVMGSRDISLGSAWATNDWSIELSAGGMRLATVTNWMPNTNGNAVLGASIPTPLDGTAWCHYALCRDGTSLFFCVNGAVFRDDNSLSDPAVYGSFARAFRFDRFLVGAAEYGVGDGYKGRMDDVRVTVGVARYTGTTYAVPTESASA